MRGRALRGLAAAGAAGVNKSTAYSNSHGREDLIMTTTGVSGGLVGYPRAY